MRFSRIRLENWRNFTAVDAALENRVFIVGANASGKSNLLDAFRFLRDVARTEGGGLQQAVAQRGGVSRLRSLSARASSDIVIDVELSDRDSYQWRYRLAFNKGSNKNDLPHIMQEKVWGADGRVILYRPDADDAADPVRRNQTLLEQVIANRDFRDIADFFDAVAYLHVVPQIVRDTSRVFEGEMLAFGSDLLEQIAAKDARTQKPRLKRIERAIQIAIPQLSNLRLKRDSRGIAHLEGKYDHWRPRGAWQNEQDFSDGTLRLIGLLWALQEGNDPLLLEEPELSLHPGVVKELPQMIYSILRAPKQTIRQVIISTHSKDLLSDPGIDANEVLLLSPSEEGTTIQRGADLADVHDQLDAGFNLGEVVLSRTKPDNLSQLALFDD